MMSQMEVGDHLQPARVEMGRVLGEGQLEGF